MTEPYDNDLSDLYCDVRDGEITVAEFIAKIRARATPADQEPVAYLHTLHLEGDQANERLTFDEANAFGKPGRDYSAEYRVTSVPLYAQPPQNAADHIEAQSVPVAWITKEQLSQLTDLTADAWVYWRESGHVAENDEIALYAKAPQSDAQSVRDDVIEECANKCEALADLFEDQQQFALDLCADALRALKSAPPQKPVSDEVKP